MKLSEIFNNPIEPTDHYTDRYGDTLRFKVNGIQYEVMITALDRGKWELVFDAEISPGHRVDHVTGTGNEIAVFSTVNAIVLKFLSQSLDAVQTLSFTADTPSRVKLYQRLARQWASKFGMSVNGKQNEYNTEFTLTNPNYEA